MMVLTLPGAERFGGLATRLGATGARVAVHRFPDGECLVRLPPAMQGESVVLVAALERPDDKLLPLLFAVRTACELGASTVGLVAPYLPYLRQDRRFHRGEAVSARYFADLLSRDLDWVATVDPHLHRIATLRDVFGIPSDAVHATPAVAAWIRQHVPAPIILGPDAESAQWVSTLAQALDAPCAVFSKRRLGDRRVEITLPELSAPAGRTPILVDDVIASGVTMAAAVRALGEAGWPTPVCLAIHGLFADGAESLLRAAGAGTIVTSNSIAHSSNAIDLEPLLAEAVGRRLELVPATGAIA
jgi:ribose-phosphate pyrophosphokinase